MTFIFSGTHKKFSLVLLQMTSTSLALEKYKKRMQYFLNIFLVQGFCPLKIKITQFPGGLRLKMFFFFFSVMSQVKKNCVLPIGVEPLTF